MEPKTGFFQDDLGNKSYTRLVGFILLWAVLAIMCWHEIKHKASMGDEAYSNNYIVFIGMCLGFVFFPKLMQKIVEAILQWWAMKFGQKIETSTTTAAVSVTQETTKPV